MEAEYMAMSIATQEIMWLCTLLSKLGFQQETATPLQTNNQSAIDLANNLAFHGWSKHIDIWHHFIQECVASNEVTVWHCASEVNAADVLTKALPKVRHWELLTLAGMTPELRGSVNNE